MHEYLRKENVKLGCLLAVVWSGTFWAVVLETQRLCSGADTGTWCCRSWGACGAVAASHGVFFGVFSVTGCFSSKSHGEKS